MIVDPIVIKTTFEADSYELGETIRADYQISGGTGVPTLGEYYCYILDQGKLVQISSGSLTGTRNGRIYMHPTAGEKAYIEYVIHEWDGNTYVLESQKIDLTANKIHVFSNYDKSTADMGTPVRCTYRIVGGSGSYTSGEYTVGVIRNNHTLESFTGKLDIVNKSGTIEYTPKSGAYMFINYNITDTAGKTMTESAGIVYLKARQYQSIRYTAKTCMKGERN